MRSGCSPAKHQGANDDGLRRLNYTVCPGLQLGDNAMLKRLLSYTFASLLAFALITSQASGQQPGDMEIRQGVIERITPVQLQTNHHRGVGAIIGGLGGLGIGSLIGAGTGRDVAMVAGAPKMLVSGTVRSPLRFER